MKCFRCLYYPKVVVRTNAENLINHVFVHATPYPSSLPLSSAFCAHSCLVFRPYNLIFHSNRFTCSSPSPLPLSFSLPYPLCAILLAYPFIPDLLHPLQSSSVPLLQTGKRKRVFPQVSCIQSVGGTCGRHREREN